MTVNATVNFAKCLLWYKQHHQVTKVIIVVGVYSVDTSSMCVGGRGGREGRHRVVVLRSIIAIPCPSTQPNSEQKSQPRHIAPHSVSILRYDCLFCLFMVM